MDDLQIWAYNLCGPGFYLTICIVVARNTLNSDLLLEARTLQPESELVFK